MLVPTKKKNKKGFWDFMDSLISCMWIICKEILGNVLEFIESPWFLSNKNLYVN